VLFQSDGFDKKASLFVVIFELTLLNYVQNCNNQLRLDALQLIIGGFRVSL
jgi:hypothetical protein